MHFNFKKTVAAVLCFATVFGAAFYTVDVLSREKPVKAASVSDYQQYIKDLEAEQREIQAQIKDLKGDKADKNAIKVALQKNIDNLQSQINACSNQIKKLDDEIIQLETEIKLKTEELEKTKYTFRQRLRAIYMSGGATANSLSAIFNSEGFEDFLMKSAMTQNISAFDNSMMQSIVADMKLIEENKKKIGKYIEEQEAAKLVLDGKKKELDVQIKEVSGVISNIDKEMGKLENQSEKLEEAIKEYEEAIKNAQNVGKDQYYSGTFAWPCPGYTYITSPYGYRYHPISGAYKFHKGVDISGSGIKGKPIVAAADGIVSIATYNGGGYGYYVMVNHGTGSDGKAYTTLYAHMTKYIVSVGQKVKKGQTIGYVGTSGASTGYHLHYEIRVNGDTTNPMGYY